MLIDYLRYVAFSGRLREFFDSIIYEYADRESITGQHLRFDLDDLQDRFRDFGRWTSYWRYGEEGELEIEYRMGIGRIYDRSIFPQFKIGDRPPTFEYREYQPLKLEVIIDIHPNRWNEGFIEPRNYEGTRIIYRQAGPAQATLGSGDKLRNPENKIGTLCGFFSSPVNGLRLALTCGHVVVDRAPIRVEQPRRLWKFTLGSNLVNLGNTLWYSIPDSVPPNQGSVRNYVDAALVRTAFGFTSRDLPVPNKSAKIRPIASMLQEYPVWFRGAGRVDPTPARIGAVTIRKSIDLLRDGRLRDVGDVLMLAHRYKMYFVQRVSQDGDSGAAVRDDLFETPHGTNNWFGMILGSDDSAAYASYSEFLATWAAHQLGDSQITFSYEI